MARGSVPKRGVAGVGERNGAAPDSRQRHLVKAVCQAAGARKAVGGLTTSDRGPRMARGSVPKRGVAGVGERNGAAPDSRQRHLVKAVCQAAGARKAVGGLTTSDRGPRMARGSVPKRGVAGGLV